MGSEQVLCEGGERGADMERVCSFGVVSKWARVCVSACVCECVGVCKRVCESKIPLDHPFKKHPGLGDGVSALVH